MKPIVQMIFGSLLYGTATRESDVDMKMVYLPYPKECMIGNVMASPKMMCGNDDTVQVDIDKYPIQHFMGMILKGDVTAIDMLFVPDQFIVFKTREWDTLRHYREEFLHRGISSYVGFARGQAERYSIKGGRLNTMKAVVSHLEELKLRGMNYETLSSCWDQLIRFIDHVKYHSSTPENNNQRMMEVCGKKFHENCKLDYVIGVLKPIIDRYGDRTIAAADESMAGCDLKALYHAIRVAHEACELFKTGFITFPRPERELLKIVRSGTYNFETMMYLLDEALSEVEHIISGPYLTDATPSCASWPDKQKNTELGHNLVAEMMDRYHHEINLR